MRTSRIRPDTPSSYRSPSALTPWISVIALLPAMNGCHIFFPLSPANVPRADCYTCRAEISRPLPGGTPFVEQWQTFIWPDESVGEVPTTLGMAKLNEYISKSMAPGLTWSIHNFATSGTAKPDAADCTVPSFVPHVYGGPIGAQLFWYYPPSDQASASIELVDKEGVLRTATPVVEAAAIQVAERMGMPGWQPGDSYQRGLKHARFSDLFIKLATPFQLGDDMTVTTCYIQSVGTVFAEASPVTGQYQVPKSSSKLYFYGVGSMAGESGSTSFCFTNESPQAVTLYQGEPAPYFTIFVNLASHDLGQDMSVQVHLRKYATTPSGFVSHQPHVKLYDKTVPGPEVDLVPDELVDHDGDIVQYMWFKDFESPSETLLGTSIPQHLVVDPGVYEITLVAIDSRGAYGMDTMTLTFAPPVPPNNHCSGARYAGIGLRTGYNYGTNTDGQAGCVTSNSDVWYRFTPQCDSYVIVDTCDDLGTLYDTVLSVMDDCNGREIACNDDACGVDNRRSRVGFWGEAGVPVVIRVAQYGTGGTQGTFPLRIRMTPRPLSVGMPGFYATDGEVELENHLLRLELFRNTVYDLGPLNAAAVEGLAYDSNRGLMYGVDYGLKNLLAINIHTGEASVIGPLGNVFVAGLAYDPQNDILYGSEVWNDKIVMIDQHTGKTTPMHSLPYDTVMGLAYDPVHRLLYGSDLATGSLIVINTVIWEHWVAGPFGEAFWNIQGLGYDVVSGVLYGIQSDGTDARLATINTQTGAATQLGGTFRNVGAIGFEVIPKLPPASQCSPYMVRLPIFGGCPAYTLSDLTGVPPGMEIGGSMLLSGLPSASGNHTFWFTIDDGHPAIEPVSASLTLSVAPGPMVPPDLDQDCDVDADDLALFIPCVSGPSIPRAQGCDIPDFDNDNDIDQNDFAVLQRCYSGSGVPADPDCIE